MKAVYRTEHPELTPAEIEFVVINAESVTAYIVAPPAVSDVCGGSRHIGLEVETFPIRYAVARKSERVPVTACACVAAEDNSSSVTGVVEKMVVVQSPQRIQSGDGAFFALLPVYPPESHSFVLVGVVQNIEIAVQKFLTRKIEGDGLFACRVYAVGLSHFFVAVFVKSYARGRVQIEGDFQVAFFQFG